MDGSTNLKGLLEVVDGELVTILDEDQKRHYTVRFGDVKTARLVPDYEQTGTDRAPGKPATKGTTGTRTRKR